MSDTPPSPDTGQNTKQKATGGVPALYNATVTHWREVHGDLGIFRVVPDEGPVTEFTPGQYATLGMPRLYPPIEKQSDLPPDDPRWSKLVRRAYSIASSPLERDYLEFYVVLVDDGTLTPKMWFKKEGSPIWLDPKIRGHFTLDDVPDGKDLLMIATGTGLAPYISMLKTYRGTNRWRKLAVVHGCRLAQDLGYRDYLEQAADEDDSVVYIPALTREPDDSDWTGPRGRTTTMVESGQMEELCGFELNPETCHVFLCGAPQMIDQIEAMLHPRGFVTHTRKQPGNIHFERYW